jgi:N-acetylated-alpha-linked acidic dipeptidase
VAHEIPDPETNVSIWKREEAGRAAREGGGRTANGGARASAASGANKSDILPIGALGSGSDFATFIDHLGISSVNLGFGGEDRGGTYHSAYDTPWYIEHFGDKESIYGKAMADTAGTLVLRFANADVLPYDFRNLATTLNGYSGELKALVKQLQRDAATRQHNLDAGFYKLAADPEKHVEMPAPLSNPPDYDFSALDQAIAALQASAIRFNAAQASGAQLTPEKVSKINLDLARAERKFLNPDGLPRRPWVEHVLYAPGWYTGYGVKTMPGVREAIEDGRYDEAKQQMVVVANAIQSEASYLDSITAELTAN